MNDSLGQKAFSGVVWASLDRFGMMTLQFVVNIVLARLLMPSDFGCIGMLMIFIMVSQVLIDGGFGAALIQKKEPTQVDYSTIFYWDVFFSCCLYFILYVSAPSIATFYRSPFLCEVLRVMGLTIIINSFVAIQANRQRKQLAFRRITIIHLSSYAISSVTAILLAYKGMGVWSLVAMQLLTGLLNAILYWMLSKWYPSLCFSFHAFKSLFKFGGYLLLAGILQEVSKNLQGLIIGRSFSSTEMGLYSQANKLNDVASTALPSVIVQVIFPVYSQLKDDLERTREVLRMSVRIISFLVFPLMMVLILTAQPLINLVFGEKWDATVPYFQILCIGGFFACLQNINFYAVAAQGRSKELFAWSFYKWGLLLTLMLIGMHWGVEGVLWGMVISQFNICMVNASLVARYVGYTLGRQLLDLIPILVLTLCAGFLFWIMSSCTFLKSHLLLLILLYIAIYTLISLVIRMQAVSDMKQIVLLIKRR